MYEILRQNVPAEYNLNDKLYSKYCKAYISCEKQFLF